MSFHAAKTLAIAGIVLGAQAASAGTIDLRNLPGNFDQQSWNGGGTRLYAQSVVADDVNLATFSFTPFLGAQALDYRVYVTGDRADGGGLGFAPDFSDIRFDSGDLTLPAGSGQAEQTFNPNLAVSLGERLFLVFDSLTSGGGSVPILATEFGAATDPYLDGEFVYSNLSYGAALDNAIGWDHRASNNEDLAILAVFNGGAQPTPEPEAALLLGLGLAGVAAFRRRRRS